MQTTLQPTYRQTRQIERSPADFALIFIIMLALSLLSSVLFWHFWHVERIYTGVTVAGVPVGGMTRAGAISELNRNLLHNPLPPVTLTYEGRQYPVTSNYARTDTDLMSIVNQAYMVGRAGQLPTRLIDQFGAALAGTDIAPTTAVDTAQLRYVVGQIANEVRTPARPAAQIGDVQLPAQTGVDVDVESTVQLVSTLIKQSESNASVEAPLQVIPLAPPATEIADPSATQATSAPALLPVLLRDDQFGLEFALDPATLTAMSISQDPLRLDDGQLRAALTTWAEQIDLPPRDARLRFDPTTSSVTILQSSRTGRALDIDATVASINTALADNKRRATLSVVPVPPAVDSSNIAALGIRELVASGTTYFAGSSLARIRNIEVAAEKFDGVVIPPGGIFSFNELVEDVSAANGFEDSLIIWGDQTAVGIGGGVCQVSTTIFRAAYQAGLPIVERYNHGYVVDWYGEPGLDATIFTPTVDFRFRNDTAAHLLVEPVVDSAGGTMTFNLYGTKPDRRVNISEPEIASVIEAEPPVYNVDETLAAGQQQQVEWEKPGMTVTVQRTITDNNSGQSRVDTLTSTYRPWRAVYLVPPGADVPQTEEVSASTIAEATSEQAASEETPAVEASPDTAPTE